MRLVAFLFVVACSNKLPETRYYSLATPETRTKPGTVTLLLEPFQTEDAYDDERIVYRVTPYRLDYYQYHRWSAAPGVLVATFLEQAFERSGRFRAVVREANPDATVSLGGRVVAFEEVDASKTQWVGRIVLELSLTDARTGEVLWSRQFEEIEVMPRQHPEGLARALSRAMTRIAGRAAPAIADIADRVQVATANRKRSSK